MLTPGKPDHVVIEGIMYPRITRWNRWVQRQLWSCRIGLHYFLPAPMRAGISAKLCVCGRCGYSTWWKRDTWRLQLHEGHWKQAGRVIPLWDGKNPAMAGRRRVILFPRS